MRRPSKIFGIAVLTGATAVFAIGIAKGATAQTATPAATPTSATKNCSDFKTQPEAQAFFTANGGSKSNNFDNLDPNRNGIACEGLPGTPTSASPAPASGSRTASDGVTTAGSTAISSASANFSSSDVGKAISGTGIPAGATIASVQSPTQATLSAAATATGTTVAFTISPAPAATTKPLPSNGIFSMILAMSGLSLVEAGIGLSLLSDRIKSRGGRVPLAVLKLLAKATRQGKDEIELSKDVYIVRRTAGDTQQKTVAREVPVARETVTTLARPVTVPAPAADEWSATLALDDLDRDDADDDWPYFTPPEV